MTVRSATAVAISVVASASLIQSAVAASPTRLVHGPAVFRIDLRGADPDDIESRYSYQVVFKLNRDPKQKLASEDYKRGIDGPRGNFSVNGYSLSAPEGDPYRFRDRKNCFTGVVGGQWKPLDRVRVGRKVEVRLRPLNLDSSGRPALGKVTVVRSTLRRSVPSLRSAEARRTLRAIGCA